MLWWRKVMRELSHRIGMPVLTDEPERRGRILSSLLRVDWIWVALLYLELTLFRGSTPSDHEP